MGMSSSVIALRDMQGEFKRMLEVKKFCDSNGVSYPKEVEEFFGEYIYYESDDDIVEEFLRIDIKEHIKDINKDGECGFEVELSKLPKDVKKLRFINSY